MPIVKRPAARRRTAKQRANLTEQLHELAIHLAAYRSRLNDALSLLEGAECFGSVHLQIAEVAACLDESVVWFAEYFEEHIDQDALLTNLRIDGAEALLDQLNYLGTDPDGEDLDWTPSDLEEDSVAGSTRHHEEYPPGVVSSVLDQALDEFDEGADTGSFSCTVKLMELKKDVALISERLIDQIRVAGFRLHDEISRLDN